MSDEGRFGERRLTYREDGMWCYSGWDNDRRGPIGWHVWLHALRVYDRLLVGPDTGRNHW